MSSGDFNPRNKALAKETASIDPRRPTSPSGDDMAAASNSKPRRGAPTSSGDFNPHNKALAKVTAAIDPMRPTSHRRDDMAAV